MQEFVSKYLEATEAESWRARAHEREGDVQVGAVGIAPLGERTGRRPTSHRPIDRARKGSGLGHSFIVEAAAVRNAAPSSAGMLLKWDMRP